MYKPSGILTMVSPNGKTHQEMEEEFSIEQKRRLMEFIISPAVREIMDKIGRDLMDEYQKVSRKRNP